jgi:hypothetical protein
MNDAIDTPALPRDYRNDKAIIADGDVFFLKHALLAVSFQEALE